MATFHENLVQSFKNFRDKYLKANGVIFQFSYDSSTGKFGYKDANGNFVPFKKVQASKTVSPSTSSQTVTPDSGYDGLAQVTVNAVNLQSKTTTMTPPSPSSWSATTTKLGTVTPDSGYTGLSQADISVPMLPDGTVLTKGSTSGNYQIYKPPRTGVVFSSSYLYVPIGGSETTLWENSSPTSNYNGGDVTLSQDMDNFNYLKIYGKLTKSIDTELIGIFPISYIKTTGTGGNKAQCGILGITTTNYYFRPAYYKSDTVIHFNAGYSCNWASGSMTGNNGVAIPTKITGIN